MNLRDYKPVYINSEFTSDKIKLQLIRINNQTCVVTSEFDVPAKRGMKGHKGFKKYYYLDGIVNVKEDGTIQALDLDIFEDVDFIACGSEVRFESYEKMKEWLYPFIQQGRAELRKHQVAQINHFMERFKQNTSALGAKIKSNLEWIANETKESINDLAENRIPGNFANGTLIGTTNLEIENLRVRRQILEELEYLFDGESWALLSKE